MLRIEFGDKLAYWSLVVYCILMSLAVYLWNTMTDIIFLFMLLNCVIMLNYQKKLVFDSFKILLVLFFAYSVLSIAWSPNISYAVSTNISIIQRIVFAICVYEIVDSHERVEMVVRGLFIGGLFVLIFMFTKYGYRGLISFLNSESNGRLGEDITNANTIGISFAMAAVCSWYFVLKKKHRLFYFLCFAVFLLFIVASGSRTSLFGLIAGVTSCSYFFSKSKKLLKVLLVVGILWAVYTIIKSMGWMPNALARFENAINSILGNTEFSGSAKSRIEFAEYGFSKIKETPVFGYGAGQFRYYMGNDLGLAYSSHNNYVEVLFSYGIIGAGIWYGMFLYCAFRLWKICYKSGNSVVISLLIMRMVSDISAHTIASTTPYLILALAFACVRIENKLVGGDSVEISDVKNQN